MFIFTKESLELTGLVPLLRVRLLRNLGVLGACILKYLLHHLFIIAFNFVLSRPGYLLLLIAV